MAETFPTLGLNFSMPENSFKNYPDIKRLIGFIIAPIPSEFIFFFKEHFQSRLFGENKMSKMLF